MKIYIVAVGKLKEKYLKTAEKSYLERIKEIRDVEIIEIPDEPDSPGITSKEREGEKILSRIPKNSRVILLDINSKKAKTKDISKELKHSSVFFVIGGSRGFGDNVYEKYKSRISFSKMTFPHQVVRIVLLDQIMQVLT